MEGCAQAVAQYQDASQLGRVCRKIIKSVSKSLEHRTKQHRLLIKEPSFSLQTSYAEAVLAEVTAAQVRDKATGQLPLQ